MVFTLSNNIIKMNDIFKNPFDLEDNLQDKLERRLINYRNYAYELNVAEYLEELLSLITYQDNTVESVYETYQLNESDLEYFLRIYGNVVLGINTTKRYVHVLGYSNSYYNRKQYYNKSLIFTNPNIAITNDYATVNKLDEYDYFVLGFNKKLNIINDFEVIKHYSELHAESSLSLLSLTMQAKLHTFIQTSDLESEDSNELIMKLYNGSGYIKTSELFNPQKQILNYNAISADVFASIDNQILTTQRMLNNSLGLSDIAITKESGVSDTEAKSNTASKKAKQDTYLKPRQDMLDKVNKILGSKLYCEFRTESISGLSSIEKKELEDDTDNNPL